MSSPVAGLSSKPRVRRAPRSAGNEVDDAVFLSSSYGLRPYDWQEDVLDSWLGRRRDGRWSASTCGLAVPRQNGKNGVIEVRELFGMVALGEKFLHTAHEVKTARKAFLRIASFFENERQFPELAALVREIRKTNGQEAVHLHNGGSVEFIARSRSSGRGFTVDVLVCDEAQELTSEELEALGPTISAAPLGSPQTILTGTPPERDQARGEVFANVRTAGQAGTDARLAWTDFGVADGPCPDVTDRRLWFAHNPSLAFGALHGEQIESELLLYTPEGFAKERLGWWGDPSSSGTLPMGSWSQCADPASAPVGRVTFAVETTMDRRSTSVAVAGVRADGKPHVEIAERRPGTDWVSTRLRELQDKWNPTSTVLDRGSAVASLVPDLEAADVRVTLANAPDYAQACGRFFDAVVTGQLRHLDQAPLTSAARLASKRPLGAAWAWDRKIPGADISPLVAVTLALWGWVTREPDPPQYASTFSV